MAGEVISLISSSPPACRNPPPNSPQETRASNTLKRKSDDVFADITERVSNSQQSREDREEKRVYRALTSSPPARRSNMLELSDLSDSSEFPSISKVQTRQGPLRKDPRQMFRRTPSRTAGSLISAQNPAKALGGGTRRHFDDPIELSSTPDFGSKTAFGQIRETTKDRAPVDIDSFSFSPSPRRKTPPRPRRESKVRKEKSCTPQRSTTFSRSNAEARKPLDTPSPISDLSPPRRGKDWDPISSSAPELPARPLQHHVINIDSESEDAVDRRLSSDDSFPDIENIRASANYRAPLPQPSRAKVTSGSRNTATSKPTTRSTSTSTTNTKRTAEERARDKERRDAEREKKKQEREQAKAQKARDKARAAAFAEVNKAKTDKKISAKEMIVDIPSSLGESLTLQTQTLLKELEIEDSLWESPVNQVIRWRRKVRARYDEEKGHYEPIPQRIEKEVFALVVMESDEFVGLCLKEEQRDLDWHVAAMKRHFPDHTLLYLIQGLDPWMRKNRNLRNRQFAAAVRSAAAASSISAGGGSAQPSAPSRRRRPAARTEYVDEDLVESGLLALQVLHGALIHHTNVAVETAQWIVTFTQHISTVPYRRRRDEANASAAAFCMDVGQVRTGEDAADTYVRMLQEITRVTAPVAYGIATECPSVSQLVRHLELGGPLALQDFRKTLNKDGDLSDRTIGQALSKRIHKVFTGRDATSMDV
ncbi:hypothetical protein jhhlp_008123 [Lomentospora prolificans]|uniref:ERCC4 domain-containing protein n=1 Tax=Lomentospora prolificans TaxID=41688 RepID=A0A2N3MZM1_9PEZI|nr:hypothetical protein jhhlp_008123 [Lomentospora prolificans]